MATTETASAAETTTREYVVLVQCQGGEGGDITDEHYVIVGRVNAATDMDARKQVNKTLPEDERDAPLVAVPARYWKPKARKVTNKPVETWG